MKNNPSPPSAANRSAGSLALLAEALASLSLEAAPDTLAQQTVETATARFHVAGARLWRMLDTRSCSHMKK